ncbi:MAG: GNAT family N-acetyltransferase, partial [Gammaproteobacteria bacterium]
MFPQITESLKAVSAQQWNRLHGPDRNPFLRHEFLFGLEKTGCASPAHGWSGQHVLLWEKPGNGGNLLGAVPMYRKAHSWGEYVFDHEWARAWQRAGFLYYPKLSVCVPFTPATGPRLLIRNQQDADAVRQRLIKAAIDHARALGVSSLHWLFTDEADTQALETAGLLRRTGFQYHWRNRGFADFDDFL